MRNYARLIVFPAPDMAAAKELYTALLGSDPYVDGPYYVGYRVGDVEIGLDPHGSSGGPIVYWETEDIDADIASLTAAGATEKQSPRDVGGGMMVAQLADAAGNLIGLRTKP